MTANNGDEKPLNESETGGERDLITSKMLAMEVPMSSKETLVRKIVGNESLDDDDKARLAKELALIDEVQFLQILKSSWDKYLTVFPHVKELTEKIPTPSYNPLVDAPPHKELYVIPDFTAVASVSPQHESLTQAFSIGEQRQIVVTQMLTSRYKNLYPPNIVKKGSEETEYRVWAHESGHTCLNRTYGKIIDTVDKIESNHDPDHLTVGHNCGKYGAIYAFQEAIVEMAASEMMGLRITTLPDVLLSRGDVFSVRQNLTNEAERIMKETGDTAKSRDEIVWDLWYDSPLREEVRLMCRAIIEARMKGINPLELGEKVNQIVLLSLENNPGVRHSMYTYEQMTKIIGGAVEFNDLTPSMPPVEITPDTLDVFVPQREVLSNILAREWYELAGKE